MRDAIFCWIKTVKRTDVEDQQEEIWNQVIDS